MELIALVLFLGALFLICLEHKLGVNKSSTALLLGVVLWILVGLSGTDFKDALVHSSAEIFEIVIFLLAAMSLVEILIHYRFFDLVRGKIFKLGLSEKKQFLVIIALAFILSGVIDNLTTTIVMVQIARQFFRKDNLIKTIAAIVIAANAGGAFSPIGDVTTIMLWLADKFTATEIIFNGILPSIVLITASTSLIYPTLKDSNFDVKEEIVTKLCGSEKIIITVVLLSFLSTIVMGVLGLSPFFGLLLGLALAWVLIDIFKKYKPIETHMDASIEKFMQKADISSLFFFIGILFSVSALNEIGLLGVLGEYVYGSMSTDRIIIGNVVMGLISPIVDNVPLTAIAIEMLKTTSTNLWILLALTVGTGGSLLVVGSAAGVIAMGMEKSLTFTKYFKIAFVPALVGYVACVVCWYVQTQIF